MAPKWNVKESKKERLLGVAEVLMAPKWNVKFNPSELMEACGWY